MICSSPVIKSRDRGPVPYPDFLRAESYRSAAILTLVWRKGRLDCWVTRIRPQRSPSFCGTIKIPPCLKVARAVNIRLNPAIIQQQQWGLHIKCYIQNNQSINQSINRLICFWLIWWYHVVCLFRTTSIQCSRSCSVSTSIQYCSIHVV